MDAREKAEQLVSALLPYAEEMLVKTGEFVPYGGVITPDGNVHLVEFTVDEGKPSAEQIFQSAKETMREGAQAGKYTTTALVANVTVAKSDEEQTISAVSVALDDVEGNSLEIFFPYTMSAGKVEFGTAFAQRGAGKIFGNAV